MKLIYLSLILVFSFSVGYLMFKPQECTAANCQRTLSIVSVSPAQFQTNLDDSPNAVLLDVRTSEEYNQGHLANALNIDFNNTQSFISYLDTLDKSTPYFIYCRSGNRSGQALEVMRQKGFTNVTNLDGGINSWQASSLPIIK